MVYIKERKKTLVNLQRFRSERDSMVSRNGLTLETRAFLLVSTGVHFASKNSLALSSMCEESRTCSFVADIPGGVVHSRETEKSRELEKSFRRRVYVTHIE